MTSVAVVGAGAWGTVMASMLTQRWDTVLWAREPEVVESVVARRENEPFLPGFTLPQSLRVTNALDETVAGRDVVVVAVPAQHVRTVAAHVAPLLAPGAVVVSLAKGIEQGTRLRPTQVLTEVMSARDPARIGVLSGPNLAREVAAGHPSATVVAFADEEAAALVQRCFTNDRFRVYVSRDVIGCEVGGAAKNVIALAAGMADGLGYGWNTRAALITRGLAEITRLGVALGADALTYLGLAGNGDLIATCGSSDSRNHRVGVALAEGKRLDDIVAGMKSVAEGVSTTPAVLALAHDVGVEMPVSEQVGVVLRGECSPQEAVAALMGRRPTSELHDLS